jgi:hypothetical protein
MSALCQKATLNRGCDDGVARSEYLRFYCGAVRRRLVSSENANQCDRPQDGSDSQDGGDQNSAVFFARQSRYGVLCVPLSATFEIDPHHKQFKPMRTMLPWL